MHSVNTLTRIWGQLTQEYLEELFFVREKNPNKSNAYIRRMCKHHINKASEIEQDLSEYEVIS